MEKLHVMKSIFCFGNFKECLTHSSYDDFLSLQLFCYYICYLYFIFKRSPLLALEPLIDSLQKIR